MKGPRTCVCGRRVEYGNYCRVCAPKYLGPRPTEAERNASMPWRKHRSSAEYRRNRIARYHFAGGRCEEPSCRIRLKGDLYPDGASWECDHLIELVDGGTDEIENLRCRCLPCHRLKTAAARRARRNQSQ